MKPNNEPADYLTAIRQHNELKQNLVNRKALKRLRQYEKNTHIHSK